MEGAEGLVVLNFKAEGFGYLFDGEGLEAGDVEGGEHGGGAPGRSPGNGG